MLTSAEAPQSPVTISFCQIGDGVVVVVILRATQAKKLDVLAVQFIYLVLINSQSYFSTFQ